MKIKIVKILIVLVSIFFVNSKIYAQACGGGIYRIEIYVLNGTKEIDICYEIFPIKDNYSSIIPDYQIRSQMIEEKYALKIMNIDTQQNDLPFYAKPKGKVENGIITFNTLENYYKKYLLKLYSDNESIYILGNFFGGCGNIKRILWKQYVRGEKIYEKPTICG